MNDVLLKQLERLADEIAELTDRTTELLHAVGNEGRVVTSERRQPQHRRAK